MKGAKINVETAGHVYIVRPENQQFTRSCLLFCDLQDCLLPRAARSTKIPRIMFKNTEPDQKDD